MQLTTYAWLLGVAQLAAVFLSIVAGIIALSMFKQSREKKYLRSWTLMILVLILFAVVEAIGALREFGIYSIPWLRHIIPSFMLLLLIMALIRQINITKGAV